ncbi:hypothetical protein TCAL_13077 [Tigriopus californicus]|uniref:Uncharacterized protein n=1 Tax=Tigriopus californicus TaxID=6832 RepID=A0A553P3E1_TIGCA|nr:uncharacterized protein LOC131884286 [Tigriopus californicus]TRY72217.1 hypothetical protein TCAL_13077 [Tigriopus californicus]
MLGPGYDNPAFQRQQSYQSSGGRDSLRYVDSELDSMRQFPTFNSLEEDDIDEDSFRSDLERDSSRGSVQGGTTGNPGEFQAERPFTQSLTHEQRYAMLVREGNRRASLQYRQHLEPTSRGPLLQRRSITEEGQDHVQPDEIQLAVPREIDLTRAGPESLAMVVSPSVQLHDLSRQVSQISQPLQSPPVAVISPTSHHEEPANLRRSASGRDSRRLSTRRSTGTQSKNLQTPRKHIEISYDTRRTYSNATKPDPKWFNLFGLIDTGKLRCLFGDSTAYSRGAKYEVNAPGSSENPENIPRKRSLPLTPTSNKAPSISDQYKEIIRQSEENRGKKDALFYAAILTFVAGLLLLMSFASPYWLVSWEDTESPFKNMGLWEFCFFRYHHPDYQFDKLFHGCHALYGDEYRLIREKLLPGWLMVVQLFVTLAFILSFACQLLFVALLLRYPLEVILRFEYHFCGVVCILNGITALFLFLGVLVFGVGCWDRDWLLYPNYNYVSWSYAFAVISCLVHLLGAILMAKVSTFMCCVEFEG